jgi:hypothetical protein
MRDIPTPMDEQEVLKRFRQSSHLLLDKTPKTSFDWLFWMQHYGVPTRLLDWTESPLTALYFAVEDSREWSAAGALWILDPIAMNRNAGIHDDSGLFLPAFENVYLKNYDPDVLAQEKSTTLLPLAAIATRNNPRIQAQLGVFTIHHRNKKPIDEIAGGEHVMKCTIPAEAKSKILKELHVLGIDRFAVFPEIASIGHNIRRAMGL